MQKSIAKVIRKRLEMGMNGGERVRGRHLVAFARPIAMFVEHVVKVCARGTWLRHVAADVTAIVLSAIANGQTARARLGVKVVCWAEHGIRASSLV